MTDDAPLSSRADDAPAPVREVHCGDAIPWLRERGVVVGAAAVTSLPDVAELGVTLELWRAWFIEAVALVVGAVPDDGVALFFQTDIKREGRWIDKSRLVLEGAERAGASLLFHKVVCRSPPGTLTYGRPAYTHLVAVSRAWLCPDDTGIPDVIPVAGPLPWVRAMGVKACAHAVRFARDRAGARTILDPFCGVGTVLAVANALGVDALGVEKNRKRAERSRALRVAV